MKKFLKELTLWRAIALGFCIGGVCAYAVKTFDSGRALGLW